MTVKELIEILQELPKEAFVTFKVGEDNDEANRHAKVQLRSGDAMSFMQITRVDTHQLICNGECDDGGVFITLHDENYRFESFRKYEKEFDDITSGIDFCKGL